MADSCKCPKCPPEGAPDWVMTFGDMMSLLLTFFILLLSLSEIKKEDEFRAIVKEVKKSFGMHGGGGRVPSKDDPELTFIERIKAMQLISRKQPKKSESKVVSVTGKTAQVTSLRMAEITATGLRLTFEEGQAELSETDRQQLKQLAQIKLSGLTTVILVQGHADTSESFDPNRYHDLVDLSYHRAKAVRDYLVSEDCKIKAKRILTTANGDNVKVKYDVYDDPELKTNRRVEIRVNDMDVIERSEPEMNFNN